MGIFSYVKAGKKIFGTIKSVKPAVNKSKLQKAVDSAKLQGLKLKGKTKKFIQKMEQDIDPARKKLRQTTQKLKGEKVTESGVSKGKDLRENKMGGGMMGRRMGYSQGSNGSKKSSLGMQSVIYGLDKNPDVTKADPKAKFIARAKKVGNGKPKKKIKKQVI